MFMVVRANNERAAELRKLGEKLVANARRHIESRRDDGPKEKEAETDTSDSIEQQLVPVRAWASSLDRDRYQAHEAPDGLYIQATPPEDVVQALQHSNEDLERAQEGTRLVVRYYIEPKKECAEAIGADELAADIATARKLLANPPSLRVHDPWDTATLVAAAALEAHLLGGADLPDDALSFAADTVLRIGEGEGWPRQYEFEDTYFEEGADRNASRALPLLLLPVAAPLRAVVDEADGWTTFERAARAGVNLAQAVANEVRLHLARGLDHVWKTPCTEGRRCHHRGGVAARHRNHARLRTRWLRAPTLRRRSVAYARRTSHRITCQHRRRLDSRVPSRRCNTSTRTRRHGQHLRLDAGTCPAIDSPRSSAAVPARPRARRHRSSRLAHSCECTRSLLTLAEHGDDAAIYAHIDAYADNSALLGNLLRALSAAAEETPDRAATARRIWPKVVRHVLELSDSGHAPFQDHHYGDMALAALMPNAAHDVSYLYREVQDNPIEWWEPLALRSEVEAWLVAAAGRPICVEQLISFLDVLAPETRSVWAAVGGDACACGILPTSPAVPIS